MAMKPLLYALAGFALFPLLEALAMVGLYRLHTRRTVGRIWIRPDLAGGQ